MNVKVIKCYWIWYLLFKQFWISLNMTKTSHETTIAITLWLWKFFWQWHCHKLPSLNISRKEIIRDWSRRSLTWHGTDVCIFFISNSAKTLLPSSKYNVSSDMNQFVMSLTFVTFHRTTMRPIIKKSLFLIWLWGLVKILMVVSYLGLDLVRDL